MTWLLQSTAAHAAEPPPTPVAPGQAEASGGRWHVGTDDRLGWRLVGGKWIRASAACDWTDLLRLTNVDDEFSVRVELSEALLRALPSGRMAGVEIGSAQDFYWISAGDFRGRIAGGKAAGAAVVLPPGPFLNVRAVDDDRDQVAPEPARPGDPRPASGLAVPRTARINWLNIQADRMVFIVRGTLRGERSDLRFELNQPDAPKLRFTRTPLLENGRADPDRAAVIVDGSTLAELTAKDAREARLFLAPVLRRLAGGSDPFLPGPTDVYRAFAAEKWSPDPADVSALSTILPRFDDPDPDVRRRAASELDRLGDGVVLVAVGRVGDDSLSAQQRLTLFAFLSRRSHRGGVEADVGMIRADPLFLVDCLEFADPRVRAAARRQLEQRLGYPLTIPTESTPAEWAAFADQLRAELLKPRKN